MSSAAAPTERPRRSVKAWWPMVKQAASAWVADYAPSMGAALSYYSLRQQARIVPGSRAQQRRVALARRVALVRRLGDLQRAADRLDAATSALLVDEGVLFLSWRSNSAWAKYALATSGSRGLAQFANLALQFLDALRSRCGSTADVPFALINEEASRRTTD